MRSEHEVFEELRAWAWASENIRALWLTGSRADASRSPDALSDYDVEVLVRKSEPFINDPSWIQHFGAVMVQWPRRPAPTFSDNWVTQLVLYQDRVRIDFQITDQDFDLLSTRAKGYRVILDKDGVFNTAPAQANPQSGITPPDAEAFASRVNAFWWDIVYVPKALCRNELNYAKFMLDGNIRFSQMQPLIEWYIGATVGWHVSTGMYGRWFQRYLPLDVWQRYAATFAGPDVEDNWRALFASIDVTRLLATEVASRLAFSYPQDTDAMVTAYINELYERYAAEVHDPK